MYFDKFFRLYGVTLDEIQNNIESALVFSSGAVNTQESDKIFFFCRTFAKRCRQILILFVSIYS